MKTLVIISSFLFSILLAGCGGSEYTYVEDHELKPGPGLFSGEDGVFTIYNGVRSNKEIEEGLTETDQNKNEKHESK